MLNPTKKSKKDTMKDKKNKNDQQEKALNKGENKALKITARRQSAPEVIEDNMSWPQDDIKKLLSRMKEHTPKFDRWRHERRALDLPWDQISFDNYSGEDCFKMWKLILQRLRGFRIMEEMLADAEIWLEHPWTNFHKSKLKNRHPDMPTKPLSAYLIFHQDQMPILRKERPEASIIELTKIIAELYHKLSEKKKAKYTKKAELAKEEYIRKLEIFNAEHPTLTPTTSGIKKQKTKKITAFNIFMDDKMSSHNDSQPFKELYVKYRLQWESLSEIDKLYWISRAEEKQKELQQVTNGHESALTKKERDIFDRANGKPVKPPSNLYAMFTQRVLKSGELSYYDSKDRMKEVSLRWKMVTEKEKQDMEYQLREFHEEYNRLLKDYKIKYPETELNYISIKKAKKRTNSVKSENNEEEQQNYVSSPKRKMEKIEENQFVTLRKKNTKQSPTLNQSPKDDKSLIQILDQSTESIDVSLKTLSEPKLPPQDAITLFAKEMKKQNKKFETDEELSNTWNNLNNFERKYYKNLLKKKQQKYEAKYAEYLNSLPPKRRKKRLKMKSTD